jgi:putative oxidoreductase
MNPPMTQAANLTRRYGKQTEIIQFRRLDALFTRWLARYSIPLLRVSLGVVFLGFGLPKFFPDLSPTENLVMQTMEALTFGLVPGSVGIALVAILESVVGLCLITGRFLRVGLALLGLVIVGILSPIFLFYQELFPRTYAPTLEGQYVLMDVVLLGAGLVVAASARGARMITEHAIQLPDSTREVRGSATNSGL